MRRHPCCRLCCGAERAEREGELILSSADLDGFGRGHMSTASAKGYKYGIKFPFLYAALPSRKAELPQYFHSCELVIFAIMAIQAHFCSRAVCLPFIGLPLKWLFYIAAIIGNQIFLVARYHSYDWHLVNGRYVSDFGDRVMKRLCDLLNNLPKMWIIYLDKSNFTAMRKIYEAVWKE